ncbi:hypothetical protein RBC47_30490 [Pseudomonas fluorescens]
MTQTLKAHLFSNKANLFSRGGASKSSVAGMVAAEFARPKGQWKQYWTRHLLNLSPASRLPRGFNHKLVDEVTLQIDADPAPQSSWIDQNKSAISEAVQKLAPAEPVKKPARKKAKPAEKPIQ